jgi:uncharacterized membrane protein YvbJ
MYCQQCGKEMNEDAVFCTHCGTKTQNHIEIKVNPGSQISKSEKLLKCPKCRSTHLADGKKGFSAGKAVAGAVLTGGIGVLAGTIGSNNTVITCLSCAHKFKPGEDLDNARKKKIEQEKAQKESMKSPVFWIVMVIIMLPFFWILSKCS